MGSLWQPIINTIIPIVLVFSVNSVEWKCRGSFVYSQTFSIQVDHTQNALTIAPFRKWLGSKPCHFIQKYIFSIRLSTFLLLVLVNAVGQGPFLWYAGI